MWDGFHTRVHTEKFKFKSILQFLMNQMNKRTVFSFVYECITVFVEVISTFQWRRTFHLPPPHFSIGGGANAPPPQFFFAPLKKIY